MNAKFAINPPSELEIHCAVGNIWARHGVTSMGRTDSWGAGPIAGTRRSNIRPPIVHRGRHFAQLPELIEGATLSGSLGMRRASFASRRSRCLTQNLTIAGSTRKFNRHFFEARTN
ncbi:MAG: hypothetical protein ACRED2_07560 [Methylocella sp.]